MMHLTEDQVYDLAMKIVNNQAFTEDHVKAMMHIRDCEECYQLLNCMMALLSVTDHIGQIAQKPAPVRQAVAAKIRIVADKVNAALDQLLPSSNSWAFAPAALAGARSADSEESGIQTVEDIDNVETFVQYDPEQKTLTIQIDGTDGVIPRAFLRFADGSMTKIVFEKLEHLYWAQIDDLKDGEYKLFLEK